jgi:alpha-tubulin suppressor-like RCC1 family protein
VTTITAGGAHTCAVTTTGTARCWGYNGDRQTDVPTDLGTVTQTWGCGLIGTPASLPTGWSLATGCLTKP